LGKDGFATYRVDKPITIGLSISNLAKVMRLVNNNDSITLRCDTSGEPQSISIICDSVKQERTTEFTLNLISLDSESLGIPETIYQSEINMNASEFAKLCRELY
jgi:proliferating cell nuclear antigen